MEIKRLLSDVCNNSEVKILDNQRQFSVKIKVLLVNKWDLEDRDRHDMEWEYSSVVECPKSLHKAMDSLCYKRK